MAKFLYLMVTAAGTEDDAEVILYILLKDQTEEPASVCHFLQIQPGIKIRACWVHFHDTWGCLPSLLQGMIQ